MVVRNNGQVVADIPASKLADEAPVYHREATEPAYFKAVRSFALESVPSLTDPLAALKALLSWPTIASKNWVYRQYDHMVRDGTIVAPGSDAAVLRIKYDSLPLTPAEVAAANSATAAADTAPSTSPAPRPQLEKFIALSVDCNAT